MLPVDLPTMAELKALASVRGGPCVSIYLETTPITSQVEASRIAFGNLSRDALAQLESSGAERSAVAGIFGSFDDLADDDAFWAHQARSLAVLAAPTSFRTFRLANRLSSMVEVADRFHLKPLLRALTFPHAGFILALSENSVRLVEFFADLPPEEIGIPDLPKDAAGHARKASINDRSHSRRIHGSEGKKVRLHQYARAVAAAIRPVLAGGASPLILAANEPLASIFRQACPYPHLAAGVIGENIERLTLADLVAAARPILDAGHAQEVERLRSLYAARAAQGRVTTDLATAALAAQRGAVAALLVDIDATVPGTVDDDSGVASLAEVAGAGNYCVLDQIALGALLAGADVVAVRRPDLPTEAPLAAVLRYPM